MNCYKCGKKLRPMATILEYQDENNQKISELYIERFQFGHSNHSIGFLADITEERKKQLELRDANEHQIILIKEVHHRVKNNLQVLNSFLNLEKRVGNILIQFYLL